MLRPDPSYPSGESGDDRGEPARGSRAGLVIVVVIVVAVLATMAALYWAARGDHDAPAPLAEEDLVAAEARWTSAGPPAYTMKLDLGGSLGGTATIEVSGSKHTSDAPSSAPGTSIERVEDMFRIIREDLAIVRDPSLVIPPGMAGTRREPLRAAFDPDTGVPTAYDRPKLEDRPAFGWRLRHFARQ